MTFPDRAALAAAGVHRPLQAGICGSQAQGAESIILNGGYEDDQDFGDRIMYVGHGGNDRATGKQIGDQVFMFMNRALARSCLDGLPIRVTRGWRNRGDYSPPVGFRYDGLYRATRFWTAIGKSGYRIWCFDLSRDDPEPPPWRVSSPLRAAESSSDYDTEVERRASTIQRIVRNTKVSQRVKELHDHQCQVCGVRLETAAGPYAEGAHIRPLGAPHDGPDILENLLCLCPNHHVLFDTGGIFILPNFVVVDAFGHPEAAPLRTRPGHRIGQEFLAYHRQLFGREQPAPDLEGAQGAGTTPLRRRRDRGPRRSKWAG